MINIKKHELRLFQRFPTGFSEVPYRDDFVYVVMKRHLCVESRLSALSAAILTSNGLIDRFSLWLPGCYWFNSPPWFLRSRDRDRMVLDLQLPVQSVPITTKVVSSNPFHGKEYSIQQCVIKFVNYLRQVGGFHRVFRFPPPMKLTATI